MSSARARASASSPHGYQSTGLWACWRRYGLVSPARRFIASVADQARVPAEAERAVELAGRAGDAVDDGLAAALVPEAPQREGADRRAEAAPAELLADADRLQLADRVLVFRPDEAVGGKAAVGRFDDAVERAAVGQAAITFA